MSAFLYAAQPMASAYSSLRSRRMSLQPQPEAVDWIDEDGLDRRKVNARPDGRLRRLIWMGLEGGFF
jgi:hypothetical protein